MHIVSNTLMVNGMSGKWLLRINMPEICHFKSLFRLKRIIQKSLSPSCTNQKEQIVTREAYEHSQSNT